MSIALSKSRFPLKVYHNRRKGSELLLSSAVCAFVASGVLTAQTTSIRAQEAEPNLVRRHTGALDLWSPDGADATLDNSDAIDLTEIRVGTAMGAQAVRVYSSGRQYPHPAGPGGDITINQSGNLATSNVPGDTIASTSAAVRAISEGGRGLDADHEKKRHA